MVERVAALNPGSAERLLDILLRAEQALGAPGEDSAPGNKKSSPDLPELLLLLKTTVNYQLFLFTSWKVFRPRP